MLFFYNLLLPLGILCFLPGLWWKYRHRPGWKATFGERFGRFSPERAEELKAWHGAVWIHAVSVGEAVAALSLILIAFAWLGASGRPAWPLWIAALLLVLPIRRWLDRLEKK